MRTFIDAQMTSRDAASRKFTNSRFSVNSMKLTKTQRIVHVRGSKGRKVVRVVREHYLREDVPCRSELCVGGCNNEGKVLAAGLTHYLVPDVNVLLDFLEVLEFREVQGVIFTQTGSQTLLQSGGRRLYNRLQTLLKDPLHNCVLFANEFQEKSYCPRELGESQEQWQTRCVYSAAVWYHDHLGGQMDIVMVTEEEAAIARYGSQTAGVYVISLQDYLQNFLLDLQPAHLLYTSLRQALQERKESQWSERGEYPEHLPAHILDAGLKSGRFIQGTLNVNKHRAQTEATVSAEVPSSKTSDPCREVLVVGTKHRNRAVHGDLVVVELLPKSEWRGMLMALSDGGEANEGPGGAGETPPMATGRVVGVLQRNWRDYVVTFPSRDPGPSQSRSSQRILTVPWDRRIPKIRISTQQFDTLKDHRVVVRLDSWESSSQYPNGHTVRVLGRAGELETEVQTILIENCVQVAPFSEAQLKEMPVSSPEHPWSVDPSQVPVRRDLRETHLVFSIDPLGCEDVDDTLSVRRLGEGLLELGVHIADVTHFVKEGSLTDLEARSRATTYYLADRRFDMLPAVLSADVCSLLGGVDRYAMSVLWKLEAATLAVRSVWFGRTIIRSSYQLHYQLAQDLLNGKAADVPELSCLLPGDREARLAELRSSLEMLTHVARHLRAQRDHEGALELEGVEVRAQLDEQRNITALVPRQPLEVHETVAECMIYANHWVARKIREAFPHQALLRHHPPPRQHFFKQLVDSAEARGFHIDTRSNKELADSLDRAVDPTDPLVNRILRMMATQAMSQAQYCSTGFNSPDHFHHYGLALDQYTHFTSPIRRYADVLVHRLLTAALDVETGRNHAKVLPNRELEDLAHHINVKNRAAQQVQKLSTELFQCLFFKERDPALNQNHEDAIIYSIRDNGVLVFIPRFGVKAPVYLKNKEGLVVTTGEDQSCEWQAGTLRRYADHIRTESASGSATFRLFDHITVQISVQSSTYHSDSLHLDVVRNQPRLADSSEPSSLQGRKQLVQEVVRLAEVATQQKDRGPELSREEREFRQSRAPNLYLLLEEIRELALAEVRS
ncbi:DIS3-like exonuclease 1 [Synchiropus splendidus]|uniref:DIS3-like exonuclease 1 n=1 Tax=Synchiropus splendidus TaxID=270530 RepID=UPI00237D8F5A|nr:DIS3-like exonuclease 1 [Synchiropus splendidus]XP_053720300.1 DIS3-like exonuclease 1 [Synchiropus splendidus]XP_053720301.1 DIS3-like exonuclease 1 [Synchiropus splendidus]